MSYTDDNDHGHGHGHGHDHGHDHPLRLAVGELNPQTGYGCAMQLIAWEQGEQDVTDQPQCVNWVLGMLVRTVNDELCDRTSVEWTKWPDRAVSANVLCPECASAVLDLAHRAVGSRVEPSEPPLPPGFGQAMEGWDIAEAMMSDVGPDYHSPISYLHRGPGGRLANCHHLMDLWWYHARRLGYFAQKAQEPTDGHPVPQPS